MGSLGEWPNIRMETDSQVKSRRAASCRAVGVTRGPREVAGTRAAGPKRSGCGAGASEALEVQREAASQPGSPSPGSAVRVLHFRAGGQHRGGPSAACT